VNVISFASLTAQLEFIRQELIRHPVFVRGAGVAVDDPSYVEETRQLDSARQRLGILIRDLNTRKHSLSVQERSLWSVPRDRRFSHNSSIGDQQKNMDQLLSTATELQRLLEDLIKKSGLLKSGEMACGIGEMISKLFAQSHSQELLSIAGPPVYKPATPGQFNASPEAATVAVFIALQAYTSLRKRRKSTAA
jgi:hypothetical protein